MKTTMPPINSPDNLFHDGDPSIQRDGTLLTSTHLNNVQASVIDLQNEMTNILTQTGKTPNNTSMQLAQGIIDLIDTKLTKLSQAIQFALSPTVPDASQDMHPTTFKQMQAAIAAIANNADNTFTVATKTSTTPAAGTSTSAGAVATVYQVAGVTKYSGSLTALYKWGDPAANTVIQASLVGGEFCNYYFSSNGTFSIGGDYKVNFKDGSTYFASVTCVNGGALQVDPINASIKNYVNIRNATGNPGTGAFVGWVQGGWYSDSWVAGGCRGGGTGLQSYKIQVANQNATGFWEFLHDASGRINTVAGYITPVASDERLKQNITDADSGALERISSIKPRQFEWKYDGRADRGYIAQELAEVDARYVFEGGGADPENPILNVSQNALISDLIGAVQELTRQNKTLQEEVAALKAK